MAPAYQTGDIVVGVLAAIGVFVLIVLFIYVVKTSILKKD